MTNFKMDLFVYIICTYIYILLDLRTVLGYNAINRSVGEFISDR